MADRPTETEENVLARLPAKATPWFRAAVAACYTAGPAAGVDPVVMIAQAWKETGLGNFGRAVDESFNNLCGLKVTKPPHPDNDAHPDNHARFPTLEIGALAQAHHLRIYAGIRAPTDTPDPRAGIQNNPELLGSAPTLQQLGGYTPGGFIKWAPSPTYGEEIAVNYRRLRGITPGEDHA